MAELIDRAALLKALRSGIYTQDMSTTIALGLLDELLRDAPTVDAEPVVHAYWKLSPLPGRPLRAVCSWCGAEGLFSYNMHDAVMYYCHKCGRRMDADAPERAGKDGRDG